MNNRLAIFICGLMLSGAVAAQSMQVIGGNSYARECFQLSGTASFAGVSSRTEIEVCDKAIAHGGLNKTDLVATFVNRGVLKAAAEDYVGAVRDYNRAIEMSSDTAEAYVNRGNLWFMSKKYDEAIADYDKSLELGLRKLHIALLNKGMAQEAAGKFSLAKQSYLTALEHNPDWTQALDKLARVNGKLDKARQMPQE